MGIAGSIRNSTRTVLLVMVLVSALSFMVRGRMVPSAGNQKVSDFTTPRVLSAEGDSAPESINGGGNSTTDKVFTTASAGPSRKGSGH
ncbi:hypothetical protein CRG98_038374 [Punica granatum]|uniref:Uncharacterized protein n=1 Tax=Punica granatum TaxID=22663 RepID=A0A2I0IB94_PUNGR|nr:hypothetical protein CRG98_038374 [Punica granatum]